MLDETPMMYSGELRPLMNQGGRNLNVKARLTTWLSHIIRSFYDDAGRFILQAHVSKEGGWHEVSEKPTCETRERYRDLWDCNTVPKTRQQTGIMERDRERNQENEGMNYLRISRVVLKTLRDVIPGNKPKNTDKREE